MKHKAKPSKVKQKHTTAKQMAKSKRNGNQKIAKAKASQMQAKHSISKAKQSKKKLSKKCEATQGKAGMWGSEAGALEM